MVEVTISDLEGRSQTIIADKVQLVRAGDKWCINASSTKRGMICPLDDLDTLKISGVEVEVVHVVPANSKGRHQ